MKAPTLDIETSTHWDGASMYYTAIYKGSIHTSKVLKRAISKCLKDNSVTAKFKVVDSVVKNNTSFTNITLSEKKGRQTS